MWVKKCGLPRALLIGLCCVLLLPVTVHASPAGPLLEPGAGLAGVRGIEKQTDELLQRLLGVNDAIASLDVIAHLTTGTNALAAGSSPRVETRGRFLDEVSDLVTVVDRTQRFVRSIPTTPIRLRDLPRIHPPGAEGSVLDGGISEPPLSVDQTRRIDPIAVTSAPGRAVATAAVTLARRALDLAVGFGDTLEPSTTTAASECDVVDLSPHLCIGGTGKNVYATDFEVLVDLGGDDTYLNSAGGADPAGNGLAVSVAIDLGGNDTYSAEFPLGSGARVAQGAAVNGIGLLIDASGDDSYSVRARAGSTIGAARTVVGQGASVHGWGMLADLDGDDSYSATQLEIAESELAVLLAMGAGVGGTAALLDGAGDDRYEIVSTLRQVDRFTHGSLTGGLGAQLAEAVRGMETSSNWPPLALFADTAGNDRIVVAGRASEERPEPEIVTTDVVTMALAVSQGSGTAIALLGPGDAQIEVTAVNSSVGSSEEVWDIPMAVTVAAGVGAGPGSYGLLFDQGGNESYLATSLSQNPNKSSGRAFVHAMGVGFGGGQGLLYETEGDDLYIVRARATELRPPHESDDVPRALVIGQGYGGGSSTGRLIDAGGNDRYIVQSQTKVSSNQYHYIDPPGCGNWDATTCRPNLFCYCGREVLGSSALAWNRVQGVGEQEGNGLGGLFDWSGDDLYSTRAMVVTREEGLSKGASVHQGSVPLMNVNIVTTGGLKSGLGLLVDIGGTDEFREFPPDPPCEGKRGGPGSWVSCAPAGRGYNYD